MGLGWCVMQRLSWLWNNILMRFLNIDFLLCRLYDSYMHWNRVYKMYMLSSKSLIQCNIPILQIIASKTTIKLNQHLFSIVLKNYELYKSIFCCCAFSLDCHVYTAVFNPGDNKTIQRYSLLCVSTSYSLSILLPHFPLAHPLTNINKWQLSGILCW